MDLDEARQCYERYKHMGEDSVFAQTYILELEKEVEELKKELEVMFERLDRNER